MCSCPASPEHWHCHIKCFVGTRTLQEHGRELLGERLQDKIHIPWKSSDKIPACPSASPGVRGQGFRRGQVTFGVSALQGELGVCGALSSPAG